MATTAILLFTDGEMRMVTFQLGQIEKLISEQLPAMGEKFVRIGKSLIVNIGLICKK